VATVISLDQYRRKSRQAYLAKHDGRIERLIDRFVKTHVDVDFRQLAEDYQSGQSGQHLGQAEGAWDYVEFREILTDAFDSAYGRVLWDQLMAERWFDPRIITRDEITERCLSAYIMARCHYAIIS
jgi:hypothetical protein